MYEVQATVWNKSDGGALHAFQAVPATKEPNPPTVACLAFNPGGKLLALVLAHFEDLHDAGVLQARDGFGFGAESSQLVCTGMTTRS